MGEELRRSRIHLTLPYPKQHSILDFTMAKAWDILEKLYEGKGRNRKFPLIEELFKMNMDSRSNIITDCYLKDKLSEIATIEITLDKAVKLPLIFNGITEQFRYLSSLLNRKILI